VATDQVWTLEHEGRQHRVLATSSGARHHVRWYADGQLLAEHQAWSDKVTLKAKASADDELVVRYSGLGKPRRATLNGGPTGLGGVDLVPEAGSASAAYERRVLDHPNRYALIATAGGVAKVVVPILISLVAVRLAINVPWPHVPHPNLPDLPRIPWPQVPLPDLPDLPELPEWLAWLLDHVHYVWPIVLAYVLARAEIRRRREQDRRRAEQATDEAR
jgi:hypothetical protein